MSAPEVTVERRDAVLVVTIDRPQVKNAINTAAAQLIGGCVKWGLSASR